ncbi:hypothetical protein OJAV_G00192840 [Oryzias javanicus]|uniref:Uncharacterized protein n=1 Tax=Oryzias javanicus TaxID=123683 RepID=A0A3S2M4J7_ORYJA|nr:hypothetical protein OJAV_G00192840 [Oryzias javanicus]
MEDVSVRECARGLLGGRGQASDSKPAAVAAAVVPPLRGQSAGLWGNSCRQTPHLSQRIFQVWDCDWDIRGIK